MLRSSWRVCRPTTKPGEFLWLLRGGNDGNNKPGSRGPEPEREEIECYLAMNEANGQEDAEAALAEWKADNSWAEAAAEAGGAAAAAGGGGGVEVVSNPAANGSVAAAQLFS